jgi:hypothetical protein
MSDSKAGFKVGEVVCVIGSLLFGVVEEIHYTDNGDVYEYEVVFARDDGSLSFVEVSAVALCSESEGLLAEVRRREVLSSAGGGQTRMLLDALDVMMSRVFPRDQPGDSSGAQVVAECPVSVPERIADPPVSVSVSIADPPVSVPERIADPPVSPEVKSRFG